MQFNSDGFLMPYTTVRERLQQLNSALHGITATKSVPEAHTIALGMRRLDLRWRKGKKPSQIRVCAVEAVFEAILNMDCLRSIHEIAAINIREFSGGRYSWDKPSMLGYAELQKAELLNPPSKTVV